MSNPEHDKFGDEIGGSRWFKGEANIVSKVVVSIEEKWICPIAGCGGEMEFNGMTWPCNPPGFHHTCDICGFTAAISGKRYPTIVYRASDQPSYEQP